MRPLISLLLLCFLQVPALAALWADTQQQKQLPACCRRAGAHHCMDMDAAVAQQPLVRAACPLLPGFHAAAPVSTSGIAQEQAPSVELVVQPEPLRQVEAGFRIAASRAWHKRGPPYQNS